MGFKAEIEGLPEWAYCKTVPLSALVWKCQLVSGASSRAFHAR
jgi:hypothetical protein